MGRVATHGFQIASEFTRIDPKAPLTTDSYREVDRARGL